MTSNPSSGGKDYTDTGTGRTFRCWYFRYSGPFPGEEIQVWYGNRKGRVSPDSQHHDRYMILTADAGDIAEEITSNILSIEQAMDLLCEALMKPRPSQTKGSANLRQFFDSL